MSNEDRIKILKILAGTTAGLSLVQAIAFRLVVKNYKNRDEHWRELFNSAQRYISILEEPGLTEEERNTKIVAEKTFIETVLKEWRL